MEPAMEGECSIHALQFSGIFAAGLAPSNAASVKVTTTDGRSLEASIFEPAGRGSGAISRVRGGNAEAAGRRWSHGRHSPIVSLEPVWRVAC